MLHALDSARRPSGTRASLGTADSVRPQPIGGPAQTSLAGAGPDQLERQWARRSRRPQWRADQSLLTASC